MPLTARQTRFVQEYLVDLNGTQAAIRAGYSARTADQQAARLLANVRIAAAVREAQAKREERTEISADRVLRRWWAIATADPQELMQLRRAPCPDCGTPDEPNPGCGKCHGEGVVQPWFRDTRRLTGDARLLFAGVKTTKDGIEVKVHDQMRATEMVARHLGMFVERQQTLGADGKPVDPVRPVLTITIEAAAALPQPGKQSGARRNA